MKYGIDNLSDLAALMEHMGRKTAARQIGVKPRESQLLGREAVTWLRAADIIRNTEFKPKEEAHETASMAKAEPEEPVIHDHRSSPGLHRLYVVWAQQVVMAVNDALERLSSFSQIQPTIIAGAIEKEFGKIVATEIAYQEAVWRVATHQLLEEKGENTESIGFR